MSTSKNEFNAKNGAVIGTSSANYLQLLGSTTGSAVQILAQGSDTNINIQLVPKGSGSINIAANVVNTNSYSALAFIPSGSSVPVNGLFLPAANSPGLSTNTTERLRIDASGNILIGTTTNTNSSKVVVNGIIEPSGGFLVPTQNKYTIPTSVFPSINPSLYLDFVRSNVVDPRITFTRSTTAMGYDGKTYSLGDQNLLLNSQVFSGTGWWTNASTLSISPTAAPDGTLTATKIVANNTATYHGIYQNLTITPGTTYTVSIFALPGEYTYMYCVDNWYGNYTAVFNLSTGAPVSATRCTTSSVAVGNGWYRYFITFTSFASYVNFTTTFVGVINASTTYNHTGDNTSGIHAWGAQVEERSAATAYVPTSLNLLTYSEDFRDTSSAGSTRPWNYSNTTIPSMSIVSPYGQLSASLIRPDTTFALHYTTNQSFTATANAVVTFSLFCKSSGYTNIAFEILGFNGSYVGAAGYDLTTVTSVYNPRASAINNVSKSMATIGNGWYRCTLSATMDATGVTSIPRINLIVSNTSSYTPFSGDGVSGVYIYGAQLELGSVPTRYTPTTNTTATYISNKVMTLQSYAQNVARINWDPVSKQCRGLLIEEARQNLVTNSGISSFGGSPWSLGSAIAYVNSFVAPDGTLSASLIVGNAGGERIVQGVTNIQSTTVTWSIYVKQPTTGVFTGATLLIYNITTATTAGMSAFSGSGFYNSGNTTSNTYVGNGWYRISLTVSSGISVGNTISVYCYTDNVGGSNTNNSLVMWGGQLELGAFATSYIPTVGSSLSRSEDYAVITGTNFSNWYNKGQGTFFVEADTVAPSSTQAAILNVSTSPLGSAEYQQAVGMMFYTNYQGIVSDISKLNNTLVNSGSLANNTVHKIAFTIGNGSSAISSNGATAVTASTTVLPANVDQMMIGKWSTLYPNVLNGHIRRLYYYPATVSSTVAQGLTT